MATKQTTKAMSTVTLGNPIGNIEPKTVAAVILVAVMGLLWVRVLFRSGANTAMANPSTSYVDPAQQDNAVSEIQIRPVLLPRIPGRHDVIAADFFRGDRSSVWSQKTESAAPATHAANHERVVSEIIKAIALEAIVKDTQGKAEKACINGTLVAAGSLLQVSIQNEIQSIRVMAVQPGRVQLNWQDRLINIEMPDQKVN